MKYFSATFVTKVIPRLMQMNMKIIVYHIKLRAPNAGLRTTIMRHNTSSNPVVAYMIDLFSCESFKTGILTFLIENASTSEIP